MTMGDFSDNDLDFIVGEVVTAGDGTAGEVAAWSRSSSQLSIVGGSGNFILGHILTGGTSGLSATVQVISNMDAVDDNDPYADNNDFENLNDNYIDFSEINPFGEVN